MRALALAALLALSTSAPVPDVLLPGHDSVRHELTLTWPDDLANWRFVASPVRGFHGHAAIVRGEPFAFSSKYQTRIYALPPDATAPSDAERLTDSRWPRGAIPVAEIASLPSGHPLRHIVTALRVRAVDGDAVDVEVLGQRRYGIFGLELGAWPWAPLAVIGALGILLLWRSRPRAPEIT